MEDFSWGAILAAAAPIVTGALASMYVAWRAKVLGDGITDWRDTAVSTVDGLLDNLRKEDNDK